MIGSLTGNYCFCCERSLVPAIVATPSLRPGDEETGIRSQADLTARIARHRSRHGKMIVDKKQFGPRYCVRCLRTGRRVKDLRTRQLVSLIPKQ